MNSDSRFMHKQSSTPDGIGNRLNFVHSLNKYKQFSSCGYHKLIVLSASKC